MGALILAEIRTGHMQPKTTSPCRELRLLAVALGMRPSIDHYPFPDHGAFGSCALTKAFAAFRRAVWALISVV